MTARIAATIGLLLANAFFVAVEFSVITSRRTRLQPMAEEGDRRAQLGLRATGDLSLELAGAQLGVTMASLGLGFVAEPLVSGWLETGLRDLGHPPGGVVHTVGFIVALGLVALFHMVVGEMVPKNLTIAAPETSLRFVAPVDRLYVLVFRPVIRALNAMANGGTRLLGFEPRDELETTHSAAEIADMLATSREEGLLEDFEHELLAGALRFSERPVASVMVPWERVTTIDEQATVADLEALLVERGHSRIPVLGEHGGVVRGFLHAKDLLELPLDAGSRRLPLGRLRRMLVLRPDHSLEDTLLAMQRARLHMGVVVADGRPTGLATLEDVLEALVGDIRDESDPTPGTRSGAPVLRPPGTPSAPSVARGRR